MSVNNNHLLSLIVPVYHQENIIIDNLKQLTKALSKTRYKWELIVVLDGLVDNSFEKIKKSQFRNTRCFAYQKNRGKFYAIRFGMSKAKGNYVMFIDAGMEIDPNGISMLLEHMEWYEADIIVGSKRHLASKVNYTLQRKIYSFGYYFLVKLLFGLKVSDTQAGIKVIKKKVLSKVLPRMVEKQFAGDLELLVIAKELGFNKIYDAPIRLNYCFSKNSSAVKLKSILNIFKDTLAIYYRLHFLKYYKQPHHRFVKPKDVKLIQFDES